MEPKAEGLVILFCCWGLRGLVGEASEKIRRLSLQRVSLGWVGIWWDSIKKTTTNLDGIDWEDAESLQILLEVKNLPGIGKKEPLKKTAHILIEQSYTYWTFFSRRACRLTIKMFQIFVSGRYIARQERGSQECLGSSPNLLISWGVTSRPFTEISLWGSALAQDTAWF